MIRRIIRNLAQHLFAITAVCFTIIIVARCGFVERTIDVTAENELVKVRLTGHVKDRIHYIVSFKDLKTSKNRHLLNYIGSYGDYHLMFFYVKAPLFKNNVLAVAVPREEYNPPREFDINDRPNDIEPFGYNVFTE